MSAIYSFFNYYDENSHKLEFSSTNDRKHSLFTIIYESFAPLMWSCFKILPWLLGTYFQNIALVVGHSSEFSKAYMYMPGPL